MFSFFKGKLNADYSILSNRNFLFASLTRSNVFGAKLIRSTVMGWFIYQATENPIFLAWLALAEAIPDIIAVLFSGYIADKYGRKISTIILTVGEFFLTLALCYLVSQPFTHDILYWIYGCFFAIGLLRGFCGRGILNSLIALVVQRKDTHKATVWDGIFAQSSSIAAPIIAGMIYAAYGPIWANALVLVMMFFGFVCICFVKDIIIKHEEITPQTQWQNLTAGFRFVFTDQILRSAVLLDFIAVIFSGVTGLLPVFAKDILHVGPHGLGILRASIAIGSLSAGIFLAHYHLRGRAGLQFIFGMTAFCFSLLLFAYSTSFYLSVILLFLSGAFDWYSTMIRSTIARLMTPDRLQGRVAAARTFFAASANDISSFESGLLASLVGTIPSIVLGGVVTLTAIVLTAWKSPSLRAVTMEELVHKKD